MASPPLAKQFKYSKYTHEMMDDLSESGFLYFESVHTLELGGGQAIRLSPADIECLYQDLKRHRHLLKQN